MLFDDARDDAIFDGFIRAQPEVTFHVGHYLFQGLAGLSGDLLGNAVLSAQNLFRLDRHIGCLAPGAAAGLMDHEPRIREADSPVLGWGEKDMRPGTRYPSCSHCGDWSPNEPDDVMDSVS